MMGPETGFPGGYTRRLYIDRDGALWVTTNKAVVLRKPGAATFTDTGIRGVIRLRYPGTRRYVLGVGPADRYQATFRSHRWQVRSVDRARRGARHRDRPG